MPQMSPTSWEILYLFFITIFMLSMTMLFFNMKKVMKINKSKKNVKFFKWTW